MEASLTNASTWFQRFNLYLYSKDHYWNTTTEYFLLILQIINLQNPVMNLV